jgi:hypothetical protein
MILNVLNQRLKDASGKEIAHRLTSERRVDENTMVLFRRYVAPPDAYRGEEWVSLKPPKFAPMSRVRNPFDVCQIQGLHGERDGRSNHFMPLVRVLFVHEMPGERLPDENSKAHHSE